MQLIFYLEGGEGRSMYFIRNYDGFENTEYSFKFLNERRRIAF